MEFTIDYLADHQEYFDDLTLWMHNQWDAAYYGPEATLARRRENFRRQLNRDRIPLTIVGFDNDGPAGTASLIVSDMETRPELTPWLASVFVRPEKRNKGLAVQLIARILEECRALGHTRCYLWTEDKEGYYAARGWVLDERAAYRGAVVSIMHQDL